jgi:predicted alpha/beta superfamily hydrolase
MLRFNITILYLFSVLILSAQHTVRIKVDSMPPEPKSVDLFIAGSFNNWNPAAEQYMFQRMGNGQYYIDVKLQAGIYEYKITRGSWKEVECQKDGAGKANRMLKVTGDETVMINIAAWKDNFPDKSILSTASKNVNIADTAFYIPQLNRKRRVLIYLPENYASSGKRYPVMYMHDGQNVFDEKTSFAGEWGVDEFLDTAMQKSSIIVAVDNGGSKRANEYCPYDFTLNPAVPKGNKGEGQQYVDFLVRTLKPFIDKKYRTVKDNKNTIIAGASMGGLISLYAVLKYPKVFGGAGVFSPSVWICKEDILKLIKTAGKKVNSKIYFYCGKLEGDGMVPDMLLAFQQLAAVSKSKMITVIRDDGKHNEPTWRKEFPAFYRWLNPQTP